MKCGVLLCCTMAAALLAGPARAEITGSETVPYVESPQGLMAPDKSDPKMKGDPRWSCAWNNSDAHLLYMSYRFDHAGISNFVLRPRESHRLFIGTNNGWVCWQYGSPYGGACPNATRLRPAFAGNCP